MHRVPRSLCAVICGIVFCAGCESDVGSETPTTPTAPAAQPPSSGMPQRTSTSTLGKAKESAEGVVDKVEERDRELQRQLEGGG